MEKSKTNYTFGTTKPLPQILLRAINSLPLKPKKTNVGIVSQNGQTFRYTEQLKLNLPENKFSFSSTTLDGLLQKYANLVGQNRRLSLFISNYVIEQILASEKTPVNNYFLKNTATLYDSFVLLSTFTKEEIALYANSSELASKVLELYKTFIYHTKAYTKDDTLTKHLIDDLPKLGFDHLIVLDFGHLDLWTQPVLETFKKSQSPQVSVLSYRYETSLSDSTDLPKEKPSFYYASNTKMETKGLVRNLAAQIRGGAKLSEIAVVCSNATVKAGVVSEMKLDGLEVCEEDTFLSNASRRFLEATFDILCFGLSLETISSLISCGILYFENIKAPTSEWLRELKTMREESWEDELKESIENTKRKLLLLDKNEQVLRKNELSKTLFYLETLRKLTLVIKKSLSLPSNFSGVEEALTKIHVLLDQIVYPKQAQEIKKLLSFVFRSKLVESATFDPVHSKNALMAVLNTEHNYLGDEKLSGIFVTELKNALPISYKYIHFVGLKERLIPEETTVNPYFERGFLEKLSLSASCEPYFLTKKSQEKNFNNLYAMAGNISCYWSSEQESMYGLDQPWSALSKKINGSIKSTNPKPLPELIREGYVEKIKLSYEGVDPSKVASSLYDIGLMLACFGKTSCKDALKKSLYIENIRKSDTLNEYEGVVGPLDGNYLESSSSMDDFENCNFKYFLKNILKLREPLSQKEKLGAEPTELGWLFHKTLEKYVTSVMGEGRGDVSIEEKRIKEIFGALYKSEIVSKNDPLLEKVLRANKNLLDMVLISWLKKHQALLKSGQSNRFLEYGFGYENDDISQFEIEGVSFVGRIDRIDLSKDGSKAFVYDYKTGSPTYASKNQLAVYRFVVEKLLPQAEHIFCSNWYLFGKDKIVQMKEENLDEFQKKVREYKTSRSNGDFRINPKKGQATCTICQYNDLCPPLKLRLVRAQQLKDGVFKQAVPG